MAVAANPLNLSTIGFGDIFPKNVFYIPFVLIYVGVGLALSSIAVDILAEYLRKLHEFGKKISHVTGARVWFGGKMLTMKELVSSLGKYLGANDDSVGHLVKNLDFVVNQIIEHKDKGLPMEQIIFHNNEKNSQTPRIYKESQASNQELEPVVQMTNPEFQSEADFIDS
uniref:Potassium channel domain-containing protein n=1 Tax=Romanomermis culicivorax TaxID=13658 RepID=A0A915L5U1_ROMCU